MSNVTKQDLSLSLSSEESFLAIIALAIQADKIFSLAEKEVVKFTVQQLKIFQKFSQKQLVQKIEQILEEIEALGEEVVLAEAVKSLPERLYKTVFTVAADLITADCTITKTEQDILNKIQLALSIPQDVADKIIEVMKYKNYY